MGDPIKHRKKYSKPSHPWQGERIEEEKVITKEYGLKSKNELWKMESRLRTFSQQAKRLITEKGEQAEREKEQLLLKVTKLGLIPEGADINAVLGITLKDVMNRRLQTVIYKKNFVKSMKQARQFITHEHVTIEGKKITSPSYLVTKSAEEKISISPILEQTADEPAKAAREKKK